MDILHIFKIYQKQLDDIRENNYYGRPQILRYFRKEFKGFNDADIEILKTFLTDNNKKKFVAHLLDNLDSFPVNLLEPMLMTAVNEPDPSLNNEFIKPCRRVFDYVDIQNILLDIFRTGDNNKKIGVLKALYWARPTVHSITVHEGSKVYEQFGHITFFWDYQIKSFDEDFKEDPKLFELEYPRIQTVYIEQLKTILSEFYKTTDNDLKYQIVLRLPKEVNLYPKELQELARVFLLDIEKEGIAKNISELDKVRGIDSSFLRSCLLKTKRLFTKDKGITLKQR